MLDTPLATAQIAPAHTAQRRQEDEMNEDWAMEIADDMNLPEGAYWQMVSDLMEHGGIDIEDAA